MKRYAILLTVLVMSFTVSDVEAVIVFDDGGTHTINYTISGNDGVEVRHDSIDDETTTVTLTTGGVIRYSGLRTYDDSQAFIAGGTIGNPNWHVWAYDNSSITMTDGIVYDEIGATDFSLVTMSGGTILGNPNISDTGGHLFANENSIVNMTGGTVNYLYTRNSGKVTLSGGIVKDYLRAGQAEQASDSTITIYGTDFVINGSSVPFGAYTVADYFSGQITGTLSNGDTLNADFYIHDSSSIILIPEPATLLLIGIGAVMIRNRK